MELRRLLALLLRRWPFILIPTLVVGVFALVTYRPPAPAFATTLRFTAGQSDVLATPPPGYDPNYTRWQTSEYIINALGDWVRSSSFADAVSVELARQNIEIDSAALQGAIVADDSQSLLAVYLTWPEAAQLARIAEAVTTVLQTRNGQVFPQLGGQPASVSKLDTPVIAPAAPSLRSRLELPLRLAIGLAAGVALALVVDYFDPTIRERPELEEMGLIVMAEIPRKSKRDRWR